MSPMAHDAACIVSGTAGDPVGSNMGYALAREKDRGQALAGPRRAKAEWPTWFALAGLHLGWGAMLALYGVYGIWALLPCAVLVAFHSSLQHEGLHGHPTRRAWVNELLVGLPVGLFIPYRSFKRSHLRHHRDERLTDPYDDPESWYLAEGDWQALSPTMQAVLRVNATLAGRLVLGPLLTLIGFWRAELGECLDGDRWTRGAWLRHLAGLVAVFACLAAAGVPVWLYALVCALPGLSLLSVRTFAEHRAAEAPEARSAIVEAGWFWSLLFLNNNLHRVHHRHPARPWYELPAMWRRDRAAWLAENEGYHFAGYGHVARQWLFRQRQPVSHPLMRLGDVSEAVRAARPASLALDVEPLGTDAPGLLPDLLAEPVLATVPDETPPPGVPWRDRPGGDGL